jgi:hypothetical protein
VACMKRCTQELGRPMPFHRKERTLREPAACDSQHTPGPDRW